MSGGAVVDLASGRVIGLHFGGRLDAGVKYGFAVPMPFLQPMLRGVIERCDRGSSQRAATEPHEHMTVASAPNLTGGATVRPTIVYVHGNGNKVRKDLLERQWNDALFGQDMADSSRMAYWASLRYAEPLPDPAFDEVDLLPVSPLEVMPPPALESAEAFISEVATEARQEAAPGPESTGDAGSLEAWLRDMTYAAEALAEGEGAAPPPSSPFEALPFPRPLRILAFRALVERAFKDVYAYFFGGFKERMRRVVQDAFDGLDGPVIVVGHSLGSIIAYDVLREAGASSPDVPLFVTCGSPLAVTEVQDLVERPLEVPSGVGAWRNVSDARDLVSLDHTIRPEYPPAARCTDFLVTNDSGTHHGIRQYLRTVPVRQPIVELFRE